VRSTTALEQLRALAGELDRACPGAAGSLGEGMEETLALARLGVSGNLKRTLEPSQPCESMIEIVRRSQRNAKRWSSGEMALRWTAAGMLEAEQQFRKIIGYRDLAALVVAIERDHDRRRHSDPARVPDKEAASSSPLNRHIRTAAENPRRAGHPQVAHQGSVRAEALVRGVSG
jgi:putative transposase